MLVAAPVLAAIAFLGSTQDGARADRPMDMRIAYQFGASTRPTQMFLAEDGSDAIDSITWTRWDDKRALGTGSQEVYAEAGAQPPGAKPFRYQVEIVATDPVACGSNSFHVYDQVEIRYLGRRPSDFRPVFDFYGRGGGREQPVCTQAG